MSKILFVTSEAQPLIKTGGLADVSGALPIALKKLRCDVRVMLPAYGDVLNKLKQPKSVASLNIPGIPGKIELLEEKLPNSCVKLILVKYGPAFDRTGNPYLNYEGMPWPDNAERYALFARAACAVALNQAGIVWQPDVVHCNDWQTGLIPALLANDQQANKTKRPATLFTIHNLAYQGLFPQQSFETLGLPAQLWSPAALEFHNQLSFIKGGLVFADHITTVSPQYAEEIQTKEFGYGLEGLLQYRNSVLSGIVNGIDDQEWNPETDPHISSHYTAETRNNKKPNKQFLQQHFELPDENPVLLFGFVGRLVEQKGVDLIIGAIQELIDKPVQFIILGSGEKKLEQKLKQLAKKYPDKIGVHIGYDEALAHQIEAGVDSFLMPSRFEPCGLNQLYSLRYGTVPIVSNVGGLANTVIDYNDPKKTTRATGLILIEVSVDALVTQLKKALELFQNTKTWNKIIKNGMTQNYDWNKSAKEYIKLYKKAIEEQKSTILNKPTELH